MRLPGKKASRSARLTMYGAGIAVAGALQAVENLVPPLLPWFRLGVANIVTLVFLCTLGPAAALLVTLGKYLVALLLGGLTAGVLLGALGGLGAWAVMSLWWSLTRARAGIMTVSVFGALAHMGLQFAALALWLRTPYLWHQLPLALLWAYGAGIVIGILAWLVLRRLASLTVKPVDSNITM